MFKKIVATTLLYFMSFQIYACPCGCGSSSSQSLELGESFRYGLLYQAEIQPITFNHLGHWKANDSGLKDIQTISLSMVYALSEKISFSLFLPFKYNHDFSSSNFKSLADPSIEFYYSLLAKDYIQWWIPSVGIKTGFKYPFSKSFFDVIESRETHKVMGNGFFESNVGIDLSYQYKNWSLALEQNMILRNNRNILTPIGEGVLKPGLIFQQNTKLAYTFFGRGQILSGIHTEFRFRDYFDSKVQQLSQRTSYRYSLATSLRLAHKKTLNFSFSDQILFLKNKNTPSYKNFSLGFTHAI